MEGNQQLIRKKLKDLRSLLKLVSFQTPFQIGHQTHMAQLMEKWTLPTGGTLMGNHGCAGCSRVWSHLDLQLSRPNNPNETPFTVLL